MSRQARQRRHRHHGSGGARFALIAGGTVITAVIVATIAVVAYVLNVAAAATPPNRLHPLVTGGSSQVFASDGTRLGFIQSDELRTPVGWNAIPANLRNATVAIEDQRFYKHHGVDYTGIFRAAVKDALSGETLQGGFHDHDAADAQPLPRQRQAHVQAEDHRGQDGARLRERTLQALHPHRIPQQRALRDRRGPDGGRRPGSRADLLQQTGLPARPPASGAARGPAAGALPVQPVRQPQRSAAAAQRGAEQDGRTALRVEGRRQAGRTCPAGSRTRELLLATARGLLLRIRPPAAGQALRAREGRAGRAEGLHDDQPQHAATRAQSDRRSPERARRPGIGDRHDQPRQRRDRGDGGVRELREVAVQPGRRRPPSAGLHLQGDRPG